MLKFIKFQFKKIDLILLAATSFLSVVSILIIFGCMENFGRSKLVMQIAMTLAGIFAMWVLANLDYKFFVDRLWLILLIGSVALLVITLAFGSSGANRDTANKSWLTIPFINIAIQPSEFVKIAFLCTFSKHIDTVKDRINKPKVLLGLLAHAGLVIGLILLSGDLGVALVYMGIVAIMLFCAGLSGWYFLAVLAVCVVAFPFLWDFLKPYQQNRIIYGFAPHLDPNDFGMQPLMSRDTIASGGMFGIGLFTKGGMYEKLPASHTDFIFATVCEKLGFVGGAAVVCALVVLAIRLFWLGMRCRDGVGRLICCGAAAVIVIQSVENLYMCLALVPVIGITLPFMSAGGSSLLAMYMLFGLVHSVYAREKRFYFN